MAFLISTTGTSDIVELPDLGLRKFTHPTVDFDLETEYSSNELDKSSDLKDAISDGKLVTKDENDILLVWTGKFWGPGEKGKTNASSEDLSSTTSTDWQVKCQLNIPAVNNGLYKLEWYYEYAGWRDQDDMEIVRVKCDDHTYAESMDVSAWSSNSGFYICEGAGDKTIEIQFKSPHKNKQTKIKRARLYVQRVT